MLSFLKPKKYIDLKPDGFKSTLKESIKPFILDVRSQHEFKEEKIMNAYNINLIDPEFKTKINNLDKKRPYFVYCQSGMRSRKACKILTDNNFKDVYNLKGGLKQWEGRTV